MTDEELALIWNAGVFDGEAEAPAGRLTTRKGVLVLKPSGRTLSPAAALLSPSLARALHAPCSPPAPRLQALCERYDLGAFASAAVPAAVFAARLAACRACDLWTEGQTSGRCASVRCQCARRHVWPKAEACPEGKWQA